MFTGCSSNSTPDNIIPEDQYIDVLVELQLVRTHHNSMPDSVDADSLAQIIYEKYEIDKEQFLNSHEFYQTQVQRQLMRTEKAIQRLEDENQKIQSKIDSARAEKARMDSLQTDTTAIEIDEEL